MLPEGRARGGRLLWSTGSRKTVLLTMVLVLFNELILEVLGVGLRRKKLLVCCVDQMGEVQVPTSEP
jgi:hypothetical protein